MDTSRRLFYSSLPLITLLNIAVLWGDVIGRSLLLEESGIRYLPLALIIEAICTLIAISALENWKPEHPGAAFPALICATGIALILISKTGVNARISAFILFVARGMIRDLLLYHTWQYMMSFYDAGIRYLLPRLSLYSKLISALSGFIFLVVPANEMVWWWCASLLVSMIAIGLFMDEYHRLPRIYDHVPPQTTIQNVSASLRHSRLMLLLTGIAFCTMFIATLIFYETSGAFLNHERELMPLIGTIYSLAALFSLFNQRTRRSTFSLPAMTFSLCVVIFLPGIAGIADVGRRMVQINPAQAQMRNMLPASIRAWERLVLEGIASPLGKLCAGMILLFFTQNWFVVVLGLLVLAALAYSEYHASKLYDRALKASFLTGHSLRIAGQENWGAQHEIVQRLLQQLKDTSPYDRNILLTVQALSETEADEGFHEVIRLWSHFPYYIQAELLIPLVEGWYKYRKTQAVQYIVEQATESEHTELRRASLQVIATYPTFFNPQQIIRYLIDPDPSVSTQAAFLLLKHPYERLNKAARAQLLWLARSGASETRSLAITALLQSGLAPDLDPFLADNSVRVRMAAVEGANPKALALAVQDVSAAVREVAIRQLQQKHRTGKAALRELIVMKRLRLAQSPYSIESILAYWQLMSAMMRLQPDEKMALHEIPSSLRHVDQITALIKAVESINPILLKPLIMQLQHDRAQLIEIILDYLGNVYGKAQITAIVRTLRQRHTSEAINKLGTFTTPHVARQLYQIIRGSLDVCISDHPPELETQKAVKLLVEQQDSWRNLLAIYSIQPAVTERIETVLEQALRHPDDAIREAARVIRKRYAGEREEGMLSTIERMIFLRNVSFFKNLRLDQLRTLGRICTEQAFNRGEYIVKQGEAGDSLFIIVEGQLRIIDPSLDDRVLATRYPGEVVGEISLFDRGLRSASAVADTDCLLLVVSREALNDALADDPGIAMDLLSVMAQRVRESQLKEARITSQ